MREHHRVEIELFQICGWSLADHRPRIWSDLVCMVHAAGIGGGISTSVRDTDLEVGVVLENSIEDQAADGDRLFEGIADNVVEMVVGRPMTAGVAEWMDEDEGAELLRGSKNRTKPLLREIRTGD